MAKFSDNNMAAVQWDEVQISLGTLAAGIAKQSDSRIDGARLQGFCVLRTEWFVTVKALTAGEGPLLLTLAHDLTTAEVQETIGADPQRSNDPESSARSKQPLWPLTHLFNKTDTGSLIMDKGVTKIGWSIPEGTALKWGIVNVSANDLTTGATLFVTAKHFGVWLKD